MYFFMIQRYVMGINLLPLKVRMANYPVLIWTLAQPVVAISIDHLPLASTLGCLDMQVAVGELIVIFLAFCVYASYCDTRKRPSLQI